MSECVVRMEMLKDRCPLMDMDVNWCHCRIENKYCSFWEPSHKRPDWCPILCTLPEGHGRLVDADALKEKKAYSQERHEKVVPVAEIDWMPTIVPATNKKEMNQNAG